MYKLHPSKKLIELYSVRPYQGAHPENSEFLFVGLDANFSPKIENSSIFPTLVKYLEDGVTFWREYGVHHPFLLSEYNGDGKRYHNTFSKIGFTPSHSSKVSFVEIINVPTIGVSKLSKNDLNSEHLKFLDKLMTSGCKRYIFLPDMVARLIRSTKKFKWLKSKPKSSHENIPVWAKIGETIVFKTYHLSYLYDPVGMKEQIKTVRSLLETKTGVADHPEI